MTRPEKVLLLGGILLDRYFEVDRYPEAGQDTLIHRSFDVVGGCSLNVAVTLNNLGALPYIVNQYGDDEVGKKIEQYIKSLAISKTCMKKVSGGHTGYCLTVLDQKGERTFFTYKGCEGEFSQEMIPTSLNNDFDFAYITGYYLVNNRTAVAVLNLVQQLRQNKCRTLFDPGPLVCEMETTSLRELLMGLDWLVPNSEELTMIQKKIGVGGNFVDWFFTQGGKGVAVKKGSSGVDIFTPADSVSVKGFPVNAQDTTGAGDSFVGGFIHGLVNGYSLREAAKFANACGAFTTTIKGPNGVFSLDDINNLITMFKDNKS